MSSTAIRARRGAVVGAPIAILAMLFAASPASAATAGGSCSSGGSTANYSAVYSTAGPYDIVNKVQWTLGGRPKLGNKNNVEARGKYQKALGHDTIVGTWISKDNVHPGKGSQNVGWKMKRSEKSYVEFKFTFDTSGIDYHCTGHTNSF